jgi:hypothetical protein
MVSSRVKFNKITRYFLGIILSRKFFKIASCFLVIYSLNHYRPSLISRNHSKDAKKFILFDDSSVDSSSYRDDYRERINNICKITEQRNTENRQKKVILKYQRTTTLKDEYLVVMYTEKFRQVPFFDADKTNVCIMK